MEERIVVADPVADPAGYQRELLALLGGEDPLAVLAATPAAFGDLAAGLDDQALGRRPEPGEWSVTELLGHLFDAEVAFAFRARSILGQDEPALAAYDQDAWAALPRPPFTALAAAFAGLRAVDLALLAGLPAAAWRRSGTHAERGPTSLRLLVETTAGHDIAHRKQLEQTIAAVGR
jgi:DinB superfamily